MFNNVCDRIWEESIEAFKLLEILYFSKKEQFFTNNLVFKLGGIREKV